MRRWDLLALGGLVVAVLCFRAILPYLGGETILDRAQRVQVGMTGADVETIMGPIQDVEFYKGRGGPAPKVGPNYALVYWERRWSVEVRVYFSDDGRVCGVSVHDPYPK